MKDLCIVLLQTVATTVAVNYRNILVNMLHSATEKEKKLSEADQQPAIPHHSCAPRTVLH